MSTLVLESPAIKSDWFCEKWHEDKVEFAARKLLSKGIYEIPGPIEVAKKWFGLKTVVRPKLVAVRAGVTSEYLRKIVGDPDEILHVEHNLLLNEGIQRLLDLLIAAGGTAFNNANAYIGVGDTATAEAATQTELLATQNAANRFYKAMNGGSPSRSSQTVSWISDFTSGEANFAWNEWTVAAGATTASGSGFLVGTTNLNRKVSSLGTKATGTWTLTAQVTIS